MFNNIGGKIKTLSAVITWIGIVLSFVGGFALISSNVLIAVLVIILGCLFSWISSFVLYGFGHLIVKIEEILDECTMMRLAIDPDSAIYKEEEHKEENA